MPVVRVHLEKWDHSQNIARYLARHTQDGRGGTTLEWAFTIERLQHVQEPDVPWKISTPEHESVLTKSPRAAIERMATWFQRMSETLRAVADQFPEDQNTHLLLTDTGTVVIGRGLVSSGEEGETGETGEPGSATEDKMDDRAP